MYRLAAHALQLRGKFVFSTHHHGIRQRVRRVDKSGRYGGEGSIYRCNFSVRECKDEVQPFFKGSGRDPSRLAFPSPSRLKLPLIGTSRLAERIPLLNLLGDLVFFVRGRRAEVHPNKFVSHLPLAVSPHLACVNKPAELCASSSEETMFAQELCRQQIPARASQR